MIRDKNDGEMQNNSKKMQLQLRLARVFSYIDQHLDEKLNLDRLSEIACLSKFHFHRVFFQFVGINLHQYIQLQRLKRASYQLVFHKEKTLIDIALDANFSNPESFSRSFKKHFDQAPSDFRKNLKWQPWLEKYCYPPIQGKKVMHVDIVDFPETLIAVYEHRGAVDTLNYSIEKFINWRKTSKLSPVMNSATFGLAYDDPETVLGSEFRFDICGEVKKRVPDNPQDIINKVIPGGRCAKIIHKGSHQKMNLSIHYLYREWLFTNEQSLRDFPCFFKYLNFFPEVAECDLVTEIYLPILGKG